MCEIRKCAGARPGGHARQETEIRDNIYIAAFENCQRHRNRCDREYERKICHRYIFIYNILFILIKFVFGEVNEKLLGLVNLFINVKHF